MSLMATPQDATRPTAEIKDSVIRHNTGGEWNILPGISMHEDTMRVIENSTIEP